MNTAVLFATTAAKAMLLDPRHIADTIQDTASTWPGGSSGEPVSGGGTSDPTATTAISRLTSTRRDTDASDLAQLGRSVDAAVRAVATIASRCRAGKPPQDWHQAVKDAHLMAELRIVQSALDVGVEIGRPVFDFHDAVLTIQRIHDGHCAHLPDATAKLATGDPICLSHARIGDYDRPRWRNHHVCRTCHDLLAEIGNPSELHNDPDAWPAVELLREHADMERTGRRVDYRRERTAWIESRTRRRSA